MFTSVRAVTVEFRGLEIEVLLFFLVSFVIFLAIVLPVMFRRWFFYRRRLRKNIITAEYIPPLGLTPAEISYLFNGRFKEREVAGTIVHLVHRGLLHMKKVDGKKRVFAGPRVENKLKAHERILVKRADVDDGILGSELLYSPTTFSPKAAAAAGVRKSEVILNDIENIFVQKGYIRKTSWRQFIYRSFKVSTFVTVALASTPAAIVIGLEILKRGSSTPRDIGSYVLLVLLASLVLFIPVVLLSAVLIYFRGRVTGREWAVTPKLARHWSQVVGFRQYVRLEENGKLRYRSDKLKKLGTNDVFSYAIALGFVKNWRDIVS